VRSTAAAVICGIWLVAGRPVEAARPLDTEDTGTVAAGHAELELSHGYTRDGADNGYVGGGVVSVGVAPRLEARVEGGGQIFAPDDGASRGGATDTLLGIKWRLFDETPDLPAWLAETTVRLPTGDAHHFLGAEKVDVTGLIAVSKVFGDLNVEANGGYAFVTRDLSLDYWIANVACEYALARSIVFVSEAVSSLYGPAGDDIVLLRAGLVYGWSPSVKFDTAVAFGATRAAPDLIVTTGVTISIY
jgi:hypothetical protein